MTSINKKKVLKKKTLKRIKDEITLKLQSFCRENGFKKVLVGCSGGLDSAVTIALAVQALGADNVTAITMPSKFSGAAGINRARQLCRNLNVELLECPIQDSVDQLSSSLGYHMDCAPRGVALENIQSRVRGLLLMAYSNTHGHLLLSTSNLSEISVGYCTLYGDTCGGLNLIGQLYKTEVTALAKYINKTSDGACIPKHIISAPPSAELAANQKDEDSLPAYPVLDAILQIHFEPLHFAVKAARYLDSLPDHDRETIDRIHHLINKNHFKKLQLPPSVIVRHAIIEMETPTGQPSAKV